MDRRIKRFKISEKGKEIERRLEKVSWVQKVLKSALTENKQVAKSLKNQQ